MSTIIKAGESLPAAKGVQSVPFNFDDMAANAGQYLEKIRQQATHILVQAQKEGEQIRKQAEQDGKMAAAKMASDVALARVEKQLQTLVPAMTESVRQLQQARQLWQQQWEKRLVHLAAAMASRVIRSELTKQPEIPLTLVREALELATGSTKIKLHMNPQDLAGLEPQVNKLLAGLGKEVHCELTPDSQITAGGCRVETQFGSIDQQIESQLARIQQELV